MSDKLTTYRQANEPLPDTYWLWPLYGKGFENLGLDGRPIQVPMPSYGPDELLVRHDACGICFSDVKVIRAGGGHPRLYGRDLQAEPVVLGPASGDLLASAFCTLARGGMLNIVSDQSLPERAAIDTGWLHYDHMTIVGTTSRDVAASYGPIRSKLAYGGRCWMMGAAGPMGHMHVQRAIEVGPRPSLLVATNRSSDRIAALSELYGEAAAEHGIDLVCLTEETLGPAGFRQRLLELTAGEGFDDIVILAPSIQAIEEAAAMLAPGGVVNVFAGLPRGAEAMLDLNPVLDGRQIRFVGSSGSSIADMRAMLVLLEQGALDTNRSVAAIAGLDGAYAGIYAVSQGQFPGKVVVYPHIRGLGLTPLAELRELLPSVYAKLAPEEAWTVEAEQELLRLQL